MIGWAFAVLLAWAPPTDDGIPDLGELDPLLGGSTEPESNPSPEPEPEPEPEPVDDGIPDLGELDAPGGIPDLGELGMPGEIPDLGDLGTPTDGASQSGTPRPAVLDPSLDATAPDEGEHFGDIFTGSIRIVGAFLHFDDIPELYPSGDDALLASVIRVIAKREIGKHLDFEMNYFLDLSRSPGGATTAGAFRTAGTAGSVYRTPYLQYRFWHDGSVAGQFGADRFMANVHAGPINVAVGRFPVTYTVTGLFTPNDFFAPFSAAAVNRIYKPGVDALRVGGTLGKLSSAEVVGVLGNNDGGTPTWGRSAVLARLGTVRWGFEWAVLGGKVAERWVAGASTQGDVGPVTLRAEGHVGIPDRDGDGRGTEDEDDGIHGRLAAGPTLNLGWHGMSLGAEYAFYSDGANNPANYLTRALSRFPDDQPLLAKHYLGFNGSMQIVPIVSTAVFAMVNASDGSGLTGLSLIYGVADEADIIAGVFLPWGANPTPTGDPMSPLVLGSELGTSPLTVYLEARAFF